MGIAELTIQGRWDIYIKSCSKNWRQIAICEIKAGNIDENIKKASLENK